MGRWRGSGSREDAQARKAGPGRWTASWCVLRWGTGRSAGTSVTHPWPKDARHPVALLSCSAVSGVRHVGSQEVTPIVRYGGCQGDTFPGTLGKKTEKFWQPQESQ